MRWMMFCLMLVLANVVSADDPVKYEYDFIIVNLYSQPQQEYTDRLNRYGEHGWELVSVVYRRSDQLIHYFKRVVKNG